MYRTHDNGTNWVEEQTILPSIPQGGALFGQSISFNFNILAIGAPGASGVLVMHLHCRDLIFLHTIM